MRFHYLRETLSAVGLHGTINDLDCHVGEMDLGSKYPISTEFLEILKGPN
jgi:hypothetical protein